MVRSSHLFSRANLETLRTVAFDVSVLAPIGFSQQP